MDLPAIVSPFIIGPSIIVLLFPTYRLRGIWLVLTISLGLGMGLGITSATIFLWLTLIGRPDSYYFAAELSLAVILALFAFYRILTASEQRPGREPVSGHCSWDDPFAMVTGRPVKLQTTGCCLGKEKNFLIDSNGGAKRHWNFSRNPSLPVKLEVSISLPFW